MSCSDRFCRLQRASSIMTFTVSLEVTDATLSYLVMTASGPAGLGELTGLVALAGAVAMHRGFRRALLNLSKVEPDLLFSEHLQFGTQASEVLGRLERVAAVVPPGYMDAPSAKAAQKGGLQVRTFLDPAKATAWIQQPPSAPDVATQPSPRPRASV